MSDPSRSIDAVAVVTHPVRDRVYVTATIGIRPEANSFDDLPVITTVAYDGQTGTVRWRDPGERGDVVEAAAQVVSPVGDRLFVTGSAFRLERGGTIPRDPDINFRTAAYEFG
jgi:hypothetical protein